VDKEGSSHIAFISLLDIDNPQSLADGSGALEYVRID
jgi:hypothetical protein